MSDPQSTALQAVLADCTSRTDAQAALYQLGHAATDLGHKIAGLADNMEAANIAREQAQHMGAPAWAGNISTQRRPKR